MKPTSRVRRMRTFSRDSKRTRSSRAAAIELRAIRRSSMLWDPRNGASIRLDTAGCVV